MRRKYVAAGILAVALLVSGCAVPLSEVRVDRVEAVGFDKDNKPIALAQEINLSKIYMVMGPDGAMETNDLVSRGPLVLLTEKSRRIVKPEGTLKHAGDIELKMAQWMADNRGFAVLLSVPVGKYYDHEEYGVNIDEHGGFRTFYDWQHPASYMMSPDGLELFRRWITPEERTYVFQSIATSTGVIEDVDTSWETLAMRISLGATMDMDWLPCARSYHAHRFVLSPDRQLMAMSCMDGKNEESSENCEIWLIDELRQPRQLASVPACPAPTVDEYDDLRQRYTYVYHTLAWSPDQTRLYFCELPGAPGYVIDIATGAVTSHTPGLVSAAWSRDGQTVAGMIDGTLTTWHPGDGAE
jgi:hypothetical protein